MQKTNIYVDYSDDIEKQLIDNNIDIPSILRSENFDIDVSYKPIPLQNTTGFRDKDLALVILASSTACIAIGIAVSSVIRACYRKPYLVKFSELIELRNTNGEIVLDSDGNPVMKIKESYELIEPREENANISFKVDSSSNGIVVRFQSEESQIQGK